MVDEGVGLVQVAPPRVLSGDCRDRGLDRHLYGQQVAVRTLEVGRLAIAQSGVPHFLSPRSVNLDGGYYIVLYLSM